MPRPGYAVLTGVLVAGTFMLASLPVLAQRISADTVKNGHFPEALRGHLDGHPDKSIQRLSAAGVQDSGILAAIEAASAAARAKHTNVPRPIVSPFFHTSSRSGSVNYGFIVGPDPFSDDNDARSTSVKALVVPVVIKVHQVATDFGVDANNNLILTGIKDQDMTYDPTVPAPACLGPKNNVPFTLAVQSPIFENQHWVWGGTDLGDAQYVEAFQRANFWNATGGKPGTHGIHLDAHTLPPLVIDFPKGTGIGLPQSSAMFGSACAPSALVDLSVFDEYLGYIAIPQMHDVNSGNFPIFIAGNVSWGTVLGELPFYEPTASAYHSWSVVDPAQTYAATQFGDEGMYTFPDALPLSHEVGEWMNDPEGGNVVELYNVEAVINPNGPAGCGFTYEVGDILAGVPMPPVTGKNGFTYTLQELAFFSYFYGGPSFGVNGWYSNNNTLTTDAGAVCNPFFF